MSIESTLAERGNRYGDFTDHARLCQDLKDVMTTFAVVQNTPNSVAVRFPWGDLPATHKQALEVIADKIARILSGDPNYADNWHDIQGYAKLVEDRLPQPEEPAAAIDDDSPRQQAVAQNGNTGEHYAVVDPADVDIYDTDEDSTGTLLLNPANWEAGDVLVCVVQGDSVRYGEKYVYTGDCDDVNEYMVGVQPLVGHKLAGQRYANRFRFHSRPTK